MECKSYDTGGKMSVVEKLVNWEPNKCIEVFFENGSDVSRKSSGRVKWHKWGKQYSRVNFKIASVKTKYSLKTTNIIDNYRYSTLQKLIIVKCYILRFASKLVSNVRENLSFSEDTITAKYTVVRLTMNG